MKRVRKDTGFTLLEVMVALTILAVALLGIGLMQINAINANKSGNELTQATLLSEETLEQLKAQSFDSIATSAGITGGSPDPSTFTDNTFPASQKTVAGGVTFYRVWNVTGTDPKDITAYVLWADRFGNWHRISMKTSRSSL
ncbi:MAG: hypothetical protein Kow00128_12980 [Deltaproteobacteria bacterium]